MAANFARIDCASPSSMPKAVSRLSSISRIRALASSACCASRYCSISCSEWPESAGAASAAQPHPAQSPQCALPSGRGNAPRRHTSFCSSTCPPCSRIVLQYLPPAVHVVLHFALCGLGFGFFWQEKPAEAGLFGGGAAQNVRALPLNVPRLPMADLMSKGENTRYSVFPNGLGRTTPSCPRNIVAASVNSFAHSGLGAHELSSLVDGAQAPLAADF